MEQLKATSGAAETIEASEVTAEQIVGAPTNSSGNENSNIPNPLAAAAAAAATAALLVPIPGVNALDLENAKEGFRWMAKGRVDSTGLAKYFPHTARDLREGKVSPEQLAESLGAVYEKTDITMLGDSGGNEISFSMFIAHRLTMEALPSCWFTGEEPLLDISVPFSSDLEEHFTKLRQAAGDLLVATATCRTALPAMFRTALRTTCAEWSSRLDQELFNGRRGSFLRLCPLLHHSPLEFESVLKGIVQGGVDLRKLDEDTKMSKLFKNSIKVAARGIVHGALEAKNTCWECETGGKQQATMMLFHCAKCHVARYCSRQCQESAWNGGHKKKCKNLMVKYDLYTKSVAAVDAAHETGIMHGIRLNDAIDALYI